MLHDQTISHALDIFCKLSVQGTATEKDSASYADDQQKPSSARAVKVREPNCTRQWKEYNGWSRSDNTLPKLWHSYVLTLSLLEQES